MRAKVIKSTGSWYEVDLGNGECKRARLRGKFKNDGLKLTNPVAVGDWVNVEQEDGQNTYVIDTIHQRDNLFVRKSSRKTAHDHILASNIDQAILFATLKTPKISLGFIDRFLVCAESYRIPAVIVFNKSDLYNEKLLSKYQMYKAYYDTIGYQTLLCSVETNSGLDEVKELLLHKTSLIAGHSGAGKSSVINHFNPSLELKTSEISKFSNKGTHTTTFAQMYEVFPDSYVIDSPGIKEVGVSGIDKYQLKDQFPEMRDLLNQCRFDNCLHMSEPSCKVIEALEADQIADWRYLSYLSILDEIMGDSRR